MSTELQPLWDLLPQAMACDRGSLRSGLRGIEKLQREEKPFDRSLDRVRQELTNSVERRAERVKLLPEIKYDDELPVVARKDEIAAAIRDHQVVVICGETGSGKSTQIPKICLELGRGIDGMIGHTQPRRLAARSVATRIAEELGTPLGTGVGFKIRFTDVTSPRTYIKLMTDGILLAETQGQTNTRRPRKGKSKGGHRTERPNSAGQPFAQYDTLIIDEAHERSLNIDFLLGYLKRSLPQRPDLRVIITSATLDVQRFADFFAHEGTPAPIIEVSGRTYPVEVRYRPPVLNDDDDGEVDWQRATADACEELSQEGPGDILVFMPTERDIRETARVLQGRTFAGDLPGRTTEILPLFGRLSEGEQQRIFQPHPQRRIVVATNVAESSLTVPGIHYVVDPGLARISRYSPTSKVQRLPVEPVSQSSAEQRKGRCGRIAPGICIRLYSAEDFVSRDQFTPPEIQRSNLAAVLLQMKSLHLGDVRDFPFIDPPSPTAIRSGLKTLFELGAIDETDRLTKIGQALSRLPVDPRIGRIILAGADEQCLEEVLIIASALELRDPRERPVDKQQAADTAHAKFNHESSDFLSLLKLWDFYSQLDDKLSSSKLRKACHQNFLSYNRMREWRDLHRQLRQIVIDCDVRPGPRRSPNLAELDDKQAQTGSWSDAIHRALLTGLLSNVALRGETHEYEGGGGNKLFLWPGSVAFKTKPKWIMAAELVETTKRYARMVAPIQPEWIESLAPHLVKRTHSEPHWHGKSSAAMAWEKVLLFGLPVVPRRRCRLGPIDPVKAREMFIQHALVEGEYSKPTTPFFVHNQQVKEELGDWQAKLRQGSLFVGEEAEFKFYDERIPETVLDGPSFEVWRKDAESRQPRVLHLSRHDLLVDPDAAPEEDAFPDELRLGTLTLPVEYHLEPGAEDDGVTLIVPREVLGQLSPQKLQWLVPGLLEEKIAAIIKTLPKQLRMFFVPVPESAKEVIGQLTFQQGDLLDELSRVLRRLSGEHIPVDAFDVGRLPVHLTLNLRVVDFKGDVLASGRDLRALESQLGSQLSTALAEVEDVRWNQTGITSWGPLELPEHVEFQRHGVAVRGYPMLVDAMNSVTLKLADRPEIAERQTRRSMIRLFLLQEQKRIRDQLKWFPQLEQLLVQASVLPTGTAFRSQLEWRIAERCLANVKELPRNASQWEQVTGKGRNQLTVAVQDLVAFVKPMLDALRPIRKILSRQHPPAIKPLVHDLQQQLDWLLGEDFFVTCPWAWLLQYPRYLQAMQHRWDKATTGGFPKDRKAQQQLDPFWRKLIWADEQQRKNWPADLLFQPTTTLQNYRWMLEEFRVSLFAQQLKTAFPVSEKRLNELWAAVEQEQRR